MVIGYFALVFSLCCALVLFVISVHDYIKAYHRRKEEY